MVIPPGLEAIAGRNAVREALKAGKRVRRLLVTSGSLRSEAGAEIDSLAKRRGVAAEEFPRNVLDGISAENQGFVALAAPFEYVEWVGLLRRLKSAQQPPIVLVLDTVQDPQNLGTLLRTSEALGIDAVVIPRHRSVHVTPAVVRSSAGAVEHLPVAQVTNLVRALEDLKEVGLWIVGIEMDGETAPWDVDLSGPIVFVLGGEDHGIGRLLKEKCDFLVRIPMSGKVNSLNAAVAGSMLLYEMTRQRFPSESRS